MSSKAQSSFRTEALTTKIGLSICATIGSCSLRDELPKFRGGENDRQRLDSRSRDLSDGGLDETICRGRVRRYEDFQSSCRTETMCTYRSLLVSIQAFDGALSPSILPIRTHSDI